MRAKDEIEYNTKTLQEIILVCLECGSQRPSGKRTPLVDPDSRYAYSHGYCPDCVEKVYSELEAELQANKNK